jgi:CRISPR-associated endonuclease Cas1
LRVYTTRVAVFRLQRVFIVLFIHELKIDRKTNPIQARSGLDFSKEIIKNKVILQFKIVKNPVAVNKYKSEIDNCNNLKQLLLIEARAAKEYWALVRKTTSSKLNWKIRKAHSKDPANQLLDIGYHFLINNLNKRFEKFNIPTSLGFIHKAQSKSSTPLVYDFMEWLRPFLIDMQFIKLIHKKKRVLPTVDNIDIKKFLSAIKKELSRKFYSKKLKYCITLDYWIDLNILHLEKWA